MIRTYSCGELKECSFKSENNGENLLKNTKKNSSEIEKIENTGDYKFRPGSRVAKIENINDLKELINSYSDEKGDIKTALSNMSKDYEGIDISNHCFNKINNTQKEALNMNSAGIKVLNSDAIVKANEKTGEFDNIKQIRNNLSANPNKPKDKFSPILKEVYSKAFDKDLNYKLNGCSYIHANKIFLNYDSNNNRLSCNKIDNKKRFDERGNYRRINTDVSEEAKKLYKYINNIQEGIFMNDSLNLNYMVNNDKYGYDENTNTINLGYEDIKSRVEALNRVFDSNITKDITPNYFATTIIAHSMEKANIIDKNKNEGDKVRQNILNEIKYNDNYKNNKTIQISKKAAKDYMKHQLNIEKKAWDNILKNNPNDEKLKLIAIQDLADKQRFYNSHILSGKMNVMGYSVQWGAPDGFMQY